MPGVLSSSLIEYGAADRPAAGAPSRTGFAPSLGDRLRAFLLEGLAAESRTLEGVGAMLSSLATLGTAAPTDHKGSGPHLPAYAFSVSLHRLPPGPPPFPKPIFREVRSIFRLEESPAPRRAARELAGCLLPGGRFRAIVITLSGEHPEDYIFQRRARSFGLSLPRLPELPRWIEGPPLADPSFSTLSTASEADALGAELAGQLGLAPTPLFVVGLSATRMDGGEIGKGSHGDRTVPTR